MHKSTNIAEKLLKSQILRLKKEKKKRKENADAECANNH